MNELALGPALRAAIFRRMRAFDRVQSPSSENIKHSAVAIALVGAEHAPGEACVLLTFRPSSMRAHAGQYAFPGGRCDPGETAVDTALREMGEELGLHVPATEVLGLLDDYVTRSGYIITPVVVWAGEAPDLAPNPAEVARVHRIPVARLLHDDVVEWVTGVEPERPIIRLHVVDGGLHAPTAAMLYQFGEVALRGRDTRVGYIDQPAFAWK